MLGSFIHQHYGSFNSLSLSLYLSLAPFLSLTLSFSRTLSLSPSLFLSHSFSLSRRIKFYNRNNDTNIDFHSSPPCLGFFAHYSKYLQSHNPYLKILDLAKLFVADAHIKKTHKNSFTPSQITLKYGSKNRPWFEGLNYASLISLYFFLFTLRNVQLSYAIINLCICCVSFIHQDFIYLFLSHPLSFSLTISLSLALILSLSRSGKCFNHNNDTHVVIHFIHKVQGRPQESGWGGYGEI